ncbi:MAG: NACHT domain-containing protein, partial [Rhodoferax sp.]
MDEATKRQRVEKIDNEVGELHPLLESIFRQLANVQYVEYTHGPNELGADFIIERRDEDLGRNSYIGIVAKTDRILQSFADVERQIDECGDARLIRGGMETVRLPEVWVVTSKSISHNAKQRIEEKFKTRKIHFFESDWLVTQIDRHAPHFWEEIDGAVGQYLARLDKRLDVISAQTAIATSPQVSSLQMEVDVEEVESDRYLQARKPSKPRLVNLKDEVLSNKISIVEAEMGYGKSHLARRLGTYFSSVATFKSTLALPVYASFKSYADSDKSLDDFLDGHVGRDCLDHVKSTGGKILLILDGVDEASSDQEICKVKATKLIKDVRNDPILSLVLTSRPWKALGEIAAEHGGVKKYRIRPLSVGKIITYLRQVLETMKMPARLVNDLANSGLFRQLPHNPIAATLLANIVKQEKYELPSNLTELYAKTVELMLGRWDERREISTEKQYKATERLARLLARH